jgi:hypothetical protein
MKLDRAKLETMCALPDDQLWSEVVKMAAGYGFTLPSETPSKENMQKLRQAATAPRINISDAVKLLNQYKSR